MHETRSVEAQPVAKPAGLQRLRAHSLTHSLTVIQHPIDTQPCRSHRTLTCASLLLTAAACSCCS